MDTLVEKLKELAANKERILVAIDGRGGSGKSTLARYLQNKIPDAKILSGDDFLHDALLKPEIERLKEEVLLPFSNGETITYRKFDWETGELMAPQSIDPTGMLIVEGVYTLSEEIVNLFDYKIWVEYPADMALARGLARDRDEYHKVEPDAYWDQWVALEKEYIEHEKPQDKADYIIDGKQNFT